MPISVAGSPEYCYICGHRFVRCSETHPLYATVDHVVPRAAGGSNRWSNRRPAHALCNQIKADRVRPFEIEQHTRLIKRVTGLLAKAGATITPAYLSRVLARADRYPGILRAALANHKEL